MYDEAVNFFGLPISTNPDVRKPKKMDMVKMSGLR